MIKVAGKRRVGPIMSGAMDTAVGVITRSQYASIMPLRRHNIRLARRSAGQHLAPRLIPLELE